MGCKNSRLWKPPVSRKSPNRFRRTPPTSSRRRAKIYVSIFPFEQSGEVMQRLEHQNWFIRRALGQRLRNQLKNVPEIQFFLDDSLEYIENIDKALKNE